MAGTAADLLIETIQDWGVEVIFGLPGDGIDGIMEALQRKEDQIRFIGAAGFAIEDPGECGYIIDQALRTSGPVVVEAVVDPFEPPMPPEITVDQATKFAKALARGEPNREKIVLTVASDKVR